MTDPDTTDSVPSDAASGQEPVTGGYPDGSAADDAPSTSAPDPHGVKTPGAGSSAEKDSNHWVTGDEPMTGPQASYLDTLAQQAGEEPPQDVTKAQAHDEIERLQDAGGGAGSSSSGGGSATDRSQQERPTTQWVTGDEPMTGPQASYLETLAQKAGEEPPADLTKSQASRAIDDLQNKAGL